MLIRVTARAVLSIERGGQFCGPRCMWCSSLCWSPAPSFWSSWVLVYLAAWRDSWQLIGEEDKARAVYSWFSTIVHDGIANCRFCLNAAEKADVWGFYNSKILASGLFAYLITVTRSIQPRSHNYLGHVASILYTTRIVAQSYFLPWHSARGIPAYSYLLVI